MVIFLKAHHQTLKNSLIIGGSNIVRINVIKKKKESTIDHRFLPNNGLSLHQPQVVLSYQIDNFYICIFIP